MNRTWVRVVIGVVIVLVVANLAARALDQSVGGSSPGGAPSSSYATAPRGLAAYAELLRRTGHPITRLRGKLVDDSMPFGATLMILDPDVLTDNDAGVALQFVVNGGRLVIGGDDPNRYLSLLRDRPPHWTTVPPDAPSPYTEVQPPFTDVRAVTTNDNGTFDRTGTSSAVVGT